MTSMKVPQAAEQALLPEERVLNSFVGVDGPRPGVEMLAVMPATLLTLVIFGSSLAAIILVPGGAMAAVVAARRFITVVHTTSGMLFVHSGWRPKPAARARIERLPAGSTVQLHDAGDPSVTIAGQRLWVYPADRDAAYRMCRESKSE